jgi:hypothetical protein
VAGTATRQQSTIHNYRKTKRHNNTARTLGPTTAIGTQGRPHSRAIAKGYPTAAAVDTHAPAIYACTAKCAPTSTSHPQNLRVNCAHRMLRLAGSHNTHPHVHKDHAELLHLLAAVGYRGVLR